MVPTSTVQQVDSVRWLKVADRRTDRDGRQYHAIRVSYSVQQYDRLNIINKIKINFKNIAVTVWSYFGHRASLGPQIVIEDVQQRGNRTPLDVGEWTYSFVWNNSTFGVRTNRSLKTGHKIDCHEFNVISDMARSTS